jgi:hypothetical protein|nr:MAG: hypothetical protein DIU57_19270 [Pseudomonadota bacterium]
MSPRPEAFGRELLRLTQGIDANDEWAQRAYTLIQSTHTAVDRAVDKACSPLGIDTLFDVRFRRFASIVAGRNK